MVKKIGGHVLRDDQYLLYAHYVQTKLFTGSYDDYKKLPNSEKSHLLTTCREIDNDFRKLAHSGIFQGTIEDYVSLNNRQLAELWVKKSIVDLINHKKDYLKLAEHVYRIGIRLTGKSLFEWFGNMESDLREDCQYIQNLIVSVTKDADTLGIFMPREAKEIVNTDIKFSKFGIFDDKKYRVLNNIVNADYVFKLKTRQIESVFDSEQDYNDKRKWEEFFDQKEGEFNDLKRKGYYDGTLEDYLQEDIVGTIYFKKIKQLEKPAVNDTLGPMSSPAAKELTYYAAECLNSILAESKKSQYYNGSQKDDFEGPKRK